MRARRGSGGIFSINITPIVDVMLMLLVIFILTAPVMRYGFLVSLPQTQGVEERARRAVVVQMLRDGEVLVQDKRVGRDGVVPALISELSKGRSNRVVIAADKLLRYGQVMELLGRIKEAGVEDVYLLTRPRPVPAQRRTP